jgi:hypothetical protein
MNSHIVGIYSLRPECETPGNDLKELHTFEKRNYSIFSASKDGYLRTYVSSNKKNLELVS